MLQMSKQYEPEFKKKIVRLHLEEGRTLKGLAAEYGVSKASISILVKQFREECQTNEEAKADYDIQISYSSKNYNKHLVGCSVFSITNGHRICAHTAE